MELWVGTKVKTNNDYNKERENKSMLDMLIWYFQIKLNMDNFLQKLFQCHLII